MANPSGHWRDMGDRKDFVNNQIMAVYGIVSSAVNNDWGMRYYWEARVGLESRINMDKPICGYSKTMEKAQKIVENLLWLTDTVEFPKSDKTDIS
jgi:hypothetical protein